MRELVVNTFLTLDGVMQAPGGPEEDDSGGFTFGGWSVNYWDDSLDDFMGSFMGRPFDLVLGRRTYEIFAAFWPNAPEEAGAKPLNDATKYVASHGRRSCRGRPPSCLMATSPSGSRTSSGRKARSCKS